MYKMHKEILIGAILLLGSLASCTAINKKLGLSDDNVIERTIEFVIKAETDLSIDLTPGDDATGR